MKESEVRMLAKETIEWADNLVEKWSGTTTGNIIERQKRHVEDLVDYNDMNLVSIAVIELAQMCDQADRVDDGY